MTNYVIFDTNIYIDLFRSPHDIDRFATYESRYVTRYSSVVLHELMRGTENHAQKTIIYELVEKISHAIINPQLSHWIDSGKLLGLLLLERKLTKQKVSLLQNDILIGCCAASIGATLITKNRKDFQSIAKLLQIKCEFWD